MTGLLTFPFFIAITVLGAVAYNIAVKVAGEDTNVFLFSVILTATAFLGHIIALIAFKFGFEETQNLDYSLKGLIFAVVAGLGVIAIDLGYYMAVKAGGIVVSQAIWTVGGLILTAILGILFFKEYIDIYKLTGVALGIISLLLLLKPAGTNI